MNPLFYKIRLVSGLTGLKVEAVITQVTEKHLSDFDIFWKPRLSQSVDADRNWDWQLKNRIYNDKAESWAIECEGITQAFALFDISGRRSQFIPSRQILYIYSIAVAPWNRPGQSHPRRYKAVGSTFLAFARKRSAELGYTEGVGLHSLPEAEPFYRENNMAEVEGSNDEFEPDINHLTYFEWIPKSSD